MPKFQKQPSSVKIYTARYFDKAVFEDKTVTVGEASLKYPHTDSLSFTTAAKAESFAKFMAGEVKSHYYYVAEVTVFE